MATVIKPNDFIEQLGLGKHNLNTDVLNIDLTLTAITSAHTVRADVSQIATGNGYSGPVDSQNTFSETAGVGTLSGTKITITASGGNIADFRYVRLYNDTQTSPADPFVIGWDLGQTISLAAGESIDLKFNNSDTTGTILTIAWS